jgi:hypothetical protein
MTKSAKVGVEGGVITLSGAAVGALVGLVSSLQTHEAYDLAIPPDALMGGVIAAGVWLAMTVIARRKAPAVEAVTELPPPFVERA